MTPTPQLPIEEVLQHELVSGDIVLGTLGPIIGHLLANHDNSLFSDEIVARVRGMVNHLASQMLDELGTTLQLADPGVLAEGQGRELAAELATSQALLTHCHALALEWQLAERLEKRCAIDPVLTPLLQALIASDHDETAGTAMALLASQVRFVQAQRRMELPLTELPGDLFHHALLTWQTFSDGRDEEALRAADRSMRDRFDESTSRLGLLNRLVGGMGNGVRAALSIAHAGVAIFCTAMANQSNQDRDLAVVSTNDRQLARLALALRSAGLRPKEVEEQFLTIHPETTLPEGFELLRADRAGEMLSASGGWSPG